MLRFLAGCAVAFICFTASAADFPLNKAIPDKAIVCLTKDAAVALAESATRPGIGEMVFGRLLMSGTCFAIEGMMVYTAQVHETKSKWFVYQMTFGKLTGFVPTNMKSDGIQL